MRGIALGLVFTLIASGAAALDFGTNIFLPSVGKGQGSCPGGVCAQWVTSAWIYNPAAFSATVTIYFLERDKNNGSAVTKTVTIPAGESKEYLDIFASPFGLTDVYGALRFSSSTPIVVTGRIFDSNVHTNKGTGSAGQFLAGVNSLSSIGDGQSTDVIGLARNDDWRSNIGFVEVTGRSTNVKAERLSGTGSVLGTQTFNAMPFEAKQFSIQSLGGGDGVNQRVRFSVTGGTGRIIATGSRIDEYTGDPSTVDMTGTNLDPRLLVGNWDGAWYNHTYGSTGGANFQITYNANTHTLTITADMDGNVFGGSDPPPETVTTTLTGAGFVVTRDSATFGDVEVTIDTEGNISGTLSDPGGGIDEVVVDGAITATHGMIRYVIDFGGSSAVGFVWVTKS